jgi:hypothetical protein
MAGSKASIIKGVRYMDKEILLMWYYEAGFKSGTETRLFYTVDEAREYIKYNANKIGMIEPRIYKLVE